MRPGRPFADRCDTVEVPVERRKFVTATFAPLYTGTGVVCQQNASGVLQRGHQVTVFTAAHPPGEFAYEPGLEVRRLPIRFRIGNAPLPSTVSWKAR